MNVLSYDTITAHVDSDGKLLFADPALRRLHIQAGGSDDGKFAIAALARIAQLTHKLRLPLSRMVQVSDDDYDISLWVDSKLEDNIAILSILSWNEREVKQSEAPDGDALLYNDMGEDILFLTDENYDIISFQTGKCNVDKFSQFLGKNIFDIIDINNDIRTRLEKIFDSKDTIENIIIHLNQYSEPFDFSVVTRVNDQDRFLGYECYLSPITNEFKSKDANDVDKDAIVETNIDDIYQNMVASQLAPAIRQPLGRIIANADTIGSKLNGPLRENYANYAKDIARAARHLVEIIDDLGDLQAIERPNFKIAKDDIELHDVANRLAGLLALKASEKSIEIIIPQNDNEVHAVGEFRRVLQIGLNLLANAIRYSPEETAVKIIVGYDDDIAFLSVQDEGPGIDKQHQHKIFEKFERLGRTGDGGSGLGLYISKRLAIAMGGNLTLESDFGEGACFTLKLPRK